MGRCCLRTELEARVLWELLYTIVFGKEYGLGLVEVCEAAAKD
jgi:hypothetical protein